MEGKKICEYVGIGLNLLFFPKILSDLQSSFLPRGPNASEKRQSELLKMRLNGYEGTPALNRSLL